jgi:16S rRNA (cytosine967-C5)-methyltransferase
LLDEAGGDFLEGKLERSPNWLRLSGADRSLARELALGCMRWRGTLDHLVARRTDGRPLPPAVRVLLHLGLYQLLWLDRIPAFAAVHETVALARPLGVGGLTALVNAVLRGYERDKEATRRHLADWRTENPALGWSHPDWLVDRWAPRWGRIDLQRLLEWDNTPPGVFARVNRLKTTPEALLSAWKAEGIEARPVEREWLPSGAVFSVSGEGAWTASTCFQAGHFYLQDPSTLLAPLIAAPGPGESVLDVCAAPGGKTAVLADLMQNQGKLVVHDTDAVRMKRLDENMARLGVSCTVHAPASAGMDSGGPYDVILIDAPCSNTGVLRRRVEARWRLTPAELIRLADTQRRLLRESVGRLKPGGRIVYSTCSLESSENEEVVEAFLVANPSFTCDFQRLLTPMSDGVDGAFVARLRRKGLG